MAWLFEIRGPSDAELRERIAQAAVRRHRETLRPIPEIMQDADILAMGRQRGTRRLAYIGKPNRYRALEAQRFLRRRPGETLENYLEVEFDRGGFIYSRFNADPAMPHVHTAYHPHSGTLGPVDSFARRVYQKRIGGHTLYSYKDKLNQEEIDLYYAWFEKTFRKKLRRPKARATDMKEPLNAKSGLPEMQEDQ